MVMTLGDIKTIVFDMGGTLYDTPREIVVMTRCMFDELHLTEFMDYTDQQILAITKSADAIFDKWLVENNVDPHWLPSFDDSVLYNRYLLEKFGVDGDLDEMALKSYQKWIQVYSESQPKFIESCRSVLEALHEQGISMGIASNRRNDPNPFLEVAGVLSFFDAIEYSCVPGYRKPSPYMLLQTASILDTNPRKCAYVGDKVKHDVGAAKRAEFLPILIVWCDKSEAEKAPSDAIVIHHMKEILELI